jgi:hypothetical protein
MTLFRRWATLLLREDVADLWATVERGESFFPRDSEDNSPFTEDERRAILAQLNEVRIYLIGVHRDSAQEQLDAINAKIDEIAGATSRLGRLDWRNAMLVRS